MATKMTQYSSNLKNPHMLGLDIHVKAVNGIQKLRACMEQQMTWLDEALVEAKKTFSSPEIYMIPKTPSTKRTRRLVERTKVDDEDDDSEGLQKEKPKKGSRRAKTRKGTPIVSLEEASTESTEGELTESSASSCAYNTRHRKNETRSSSEMQQPSTNIVSKQKDNKTDASSETEIEHNSSCGEVKGNTPAENGLETIVADTEIRKSPPAQETDNKQNCDDVVVVSCSDDEDLPDEGEPPPKVQKTGMGRRSSTRRVSNCLDTAPKINVDKDIHEKEVKSFHLLKVKEKASKFEELANWSSDGHDVSDSTPPQSPYQLTRKPATPLHPTAVTLTKPAAMAAKEAFEKLLGASPKLRKQSVIRRSSRLSSQRVSISEKRSSRYRLENKTCATLRKGPNVDEIKAKLLKVSKADSNTLVKPRKASPLPMRTTRSKMRAALGIQKSEPQVQLQKDMMSKSEEVSRINNLLSKTTRTLVHKQREKENICTPVPRAKRAAATKFDIGLPCKMMCVEVAGYRDKREPTSQKDLPFTFLTEIKKTKPHGNICSSAVSFLQRNTPTKKTTVDIIEMKRQQLLEKEEQARIRRLKAQEQLQREVEEKRRNREHRQRLAAQRRKKQEMKEKELKERELKKEQEKMLVKTKQLEQRQREEKEKHKLYEMKFEEVRKREVEKQKEKQDLMQEQETDRQKQVEHQLRKKEYEQQMRVKQIQEQRQKHEERHQELERERQQEAERVRQAAEQRQKEKQDQLLHKQNREKIEKMEREHLELERQQEQNRQNDQERLKQKEQQRQHIEEEKLKGFTLKEADKHRQKAAEKQNNNVEHPSQKLQQTESPSVVVPSASVTEPSTKTQLNSTYSKNSDEDNIDSYDMTPVRKIYSKSSSSENYNIDDINSDDSTDDDEAPRKRIPKWAAGMELQMALISQYYTPPDLDRIFTVIEQPDLCKMFTKKKARFLKRTSSAVWNSPLYLPSGKPYID